MASESPNLNSRRTWVIVLVAVALFGGIGILTARIQGPVDPSTLIESPRVGDLAPNFTLTTTDGESITLHELRGRPIVLNFWASWCGPCRIETPHFQAFHEAAGDDLLVIGVNQRETADAVDAFSAEFSLTYPLLLDPDGRVNDRYEIFGLPSTFFIDANGVIVAIAPGAVTEAYLANEVSDLVE